MIDELLDSARLLAGEPNQTSACLRRAVSTAYYAVFHALAELASESLLPGVARASDAYVRVYRALEHRRLKNAFMQAPLKDDNRFRAIGNAVVQLQVERARADYLPCDPSLFSLNVVTDLLVQAQGVIVDLRGLGRDERRTLAVCLLFRDRRD
ncbi:hypothetical protein LQ948_02050 [Jiella sp. MQZ9-1]|uniref:Uncharacterized protein n=1 Tax=Jiella flava TaxID=2816857 RepID=A0A939FWA5_9HYPH|nr:hypothetical protein [Jiella flava]MBO0661345.1 hypothetical protein [Jiella flava]MCD2469990.1 hypothetical protein [Jiella flava]